MKTLKLSSIHTISVTSSTLILESIWYCHSFNLNTLRVNCNFEKASNYCLYLNDILYYKGLSKDQVTQAYDFIKSAIKESHVPPTLD